MVVDFIKIEPGMSTTKPSNKKVVSTVRPTPLNKPIQSMANQQQQQIIVIPGNMLIGNKQNGQAATMEQVKSILKLATTSNQNLQAKTIVTTSNPKTTITGSNVTSKAPVVLPTLMKSTTNAAIVRPVSNRTAIVSPQQLQSTPRVISLKRPYSAITCAKPEIAEPNIIKISPSSNIQGISTITTDHIKKEVEDDTPLQSEQPVRKRANLDHMSTEEKMMRRKLKNRVAAQNARDKKRVKMDEMEDKIKRLEEENKLLMEKQQGLINLSQRLMKENEILSGKPSQEIEPTSFIKVEPQIFEDTDVSQNHVLYVPPLSPESLPRSPSPSSSISSSTMTQHQRLSSLDSDGELTDSQSSIVSSDSSDVSSLVEQRSVEPAAGTRSTLGRGRDYVQKSEGQLVRSIYNSTVYDLSYDNNTTSGQQSVIPGQEDGPNDVIKGALRASGLLDFTTKETNESTSIASSIGGEETADIDDSWLSDLVVMDTSVENNNVVEKQTAMDEQSQDGSIFTPRCHDNFNDIASSATSLLDKYVAHKNQQQLQQQQSTELNNEEFDSYFNELFPDLAL